MGRPKHQLIVRDHILPEDLYVTMPKRDLNLGPSGDTVFEHFEHCEGTSLTI